MKAVVFNVAYGLWNSGETASFSEAEADRLVAAGVARAPLVVAVEAVVEGAGDGEAEGQTNAESAPVDGKRKGKKQTS